MKFNSLLAAGFFAATTALSFGIQAAEADKATDAKAPMADTQMDKAAVKKMKPHSHVEEKTGVPQSAPDTKTERANAAKDKSKHFHPRDMK